MKHWMMAAAILVSGTSGALAQDTPPTAPVGCEGTANGDESVKVRWKVAFGNAGSDGTKIDPVLVGPAGGADGDESETGTGNQPNGFCSHYVLWISTSPITSEDPGTIVSDHIPSIKTGTQEVDFEPWFQVDGLAVNTRYYFAVQSRDAADQGSEIVPFPSHVSTSVDPAVPGEIDDLTATVTGESSAEIRWTAPLDDAGNPNSGPVASYAIRRWDVSDPLASFTTNSTAVPAPAPADPSGPNALQAAVVEGLDDGVTYAIGIQASDGSNTSDIAITFVTTPVYLATSSAGNALGLDFCSASVRPAAAAFALLALLALPLLRRV